MLYLNLARLVGVFLGAWSLLPCFVCFATRKLGRLLPVSLESKNRWHSKILNCEEFGIRFHEPSSIELLKSILISEPSPQLLLPTKNIFTPLAGHFCSLSWWMLTHSNSSPPYNSSTSIPEKIPVRTHIMKVLVDQAEEEDGDDEIRWNLWQWLGDSIIKG